MIHPSPFIASWPEPAKQLLTQLMQTTPPASMAEQLKLETLAMQHMTAMKANWAPPSIHISLEEQERIFERGLRRVRQQLGKTDVQ